jgi:hypothetical protein
MKKTALSLVLILAAAGLWSAPSTSQAIPGTLLHQLWTSYKKTQQAQTIPTGNLQQIGMEAMTYYAYVYGVVSAFAEMDSASALWPENVETEQIVDIVGKYLDEHPGELGASSVLLIVQALLKAFPPSGAR